MKIAFLGLQTAFDYFHIGGVESFLRRLSYHLIRHGDAVDYICYGSEEEKEVSPYQGLTLKYFRSFNDALETIERHYDHIIPIYLQRKDRSKFTSFRKKFSKDVYFHFIYFGWPDSLIKRKLYFSEARLFPYTRLFPYNGKLFCISKRQYEYVKKWSNNAVYLLPPVPEEYFLKPEEKPVNEKIKITFLGRIDPGKGINEVIEVFKALKDNNRLECSIYGIHIPEHKPSLQIHDWLKSQDDIKYIEVDRQQYSPAVEEFVRKVLKETDIFIQPYYKLSSTIDTPLLLLEAMASLCAVVTKPFGNIPDIYGRSEFLVSEKNFFLNVIYLLNRISANDIQKEKERIYVQNNILNYKANQIGKYFIKSLN